MGKVVGFILVLAGLSGSLYQWMEVQKERQKRTEEFNLFLHKVIFAMEKENMKIIDYFGNYQSKNLEITETLQEISTQLSKHIYPDGQMVWEMVLKEREKKWDLDKEMFEIILKTGMGFFGRSKEENICFLKKRLDELEEQQRKRKEKDAKERKVWIPVTMLSGVMLTILLM